MSTTAPLVLTTDEYTAIRDELDVDPSMQMRELLSEVAPGEEWAVDLAGWRWAIRRFQARIDLLETIEGAASDSPLPPWAVADLRELLPGLAVWIIERARESEANPGEHLDDLALRRKDRAAVLGLAERLGVNIPQAVA